MQNPTQGTTYKGSVFLLPRPLIWQLYLLSWICGSFSAVWPLPSLLCFLILMLACKNLWKLPSLLLSLALFTASSLLIDYLLAQTESVCAKLPPWAVNDGPYKGEFCGEISQVQGMPNRRVRLLLDKLHPQAANTSQALPLFCALVREDDDPFFSPVPGQTACFKGSIRKMRPNLNSDSDLNRVDWKIRQLHWQAYSNKNSESFKISGDKNPIFALREKIRHDFLIILGFKPGQALSQKSWQSPEIQAKAILLALCFGDRRMLSYNTSDNFAAATLAHSLALSGQHLGIAGLIALGLVLCAGKWRPSIFLLLPRMRLIFLFSLPLALLYLWLGNAPPSLLRAAAMLFLAAIYIFKGKSFTGMDLLCGAVLIFIIIRPLSIFDLGLQLSILCVFLIIIFAPFIAAAGKKLPQLSNPVLNRIFRTSCQIILISLIIQLFLLPLNLLNFHIAGFCFPLNLLWLPVLGIFVLPLAFFALGISLIPGSLPLYAAEMIMDLAAYPCQILLELLEKLRSWHLLEEHAFIHPHWLYLVVFTLLAVSLASLLAHPEKRKPRGFPFHFLLISCLLILIPPILRLMDNFQSKLSIEILDVGQGLSVILKSPNNLRILYDGGGSATSHFDTGKNLVAPFLTQNKYPRLDAVINSHPDMDHMGGLFYILENFKVDHFYHNGHEARGSTKESWTALQKAKNSHTLYAGDIIYLDREKEGLRLEVLHPPASELEENGGVPSPDKEWRGNHASLVMRLCKGNEGLLLLTGDAEKDALKNLINSGQNLQARVLVAPHHGSDRSLLRNFYREVKPELVLAGCAFQNRWNYPGRRLQNFLRELDIPLLDTGRNGKIKVDFESNGKLDIRAMLEGKQDRWIKKLEYLAKSLISGNEDKKQ